MQAAVLIHDGEALLVAVAATAEEAMAKLRAAHIAETAEWHNGDQDAAAEAIQDDEDAGNIEFCVCPVVG